MEHNIKSWWKGLTTKEKSGFMVLGAFLASVIILYSGIQFGQAIGLVINN
ncbi:MAG: hypothetical protein ABJJ44_15290 [Paraglaciecola sp.]